MELFANALLIVLIVLMLIAFMLTAIFTRANLEDRVKKARQIAAIINGRTSKSLWQSEDPRRTNAVVIYGKWQNYDINLILNPSSFRLKILFPMLKKRGCWFISFPKVIDTNIVWGGRYLYSTLQYDDFFDKDDVLYQTEFNLALIKLETTSKQLSNIH